MTNHVEVPHAATGYAKLTVVMRRLEADAVARCLEHALHQPDDWYAKIALLEKLMSEASKTDT